jgi:transcriptional regulator with XRE-family HTH domain
LEGGVRVTAQIDDVLTMKETASHLKISPATLSRILNGKRPGPKLPAMWFGSRPVVRREDLEAYKLAKVQEGKPRA